MIRALATGSVFPQGSGTIGLLLLIYSLQSYSKPDPSKFFIGYNRSIKIILKMDKR
ncbi:hypothetical protein [Niabella ginsenosidivorans]|uniref:hypothetical protein n=1 Tax=Niabella ginsenosidivorans TaxID=1176587 RepID=UPI0012EDEF02|nr:hypothetical protein [Niabella ginsenosidivorans]